MCVSAAQVRGNPCQPLRSPLQAQQAQEAKPPKTQIHGIEFLTVTLFLLTAVSTHVTTDFTIYAQLLNEDSISFMVNKKYNYFTNTGNTDQYIQ